ncbi:hypothetical protein ACFLY5_01185 [Patescibacteria group bacterium]
MFVWAIFRGHQIIAMEKELKETKVEIEKKKSLGRPLMPWER